MIKANYHTHTTFCDGKDTAEDIVKYAVSLGMTHLGFSGHMDPEIHMDFPLYAAEIGRLKRFGKENGLDILTGVELDVLYEPAFTEEVEYMIGSTHYLDVVTEEPTSIDSSPEHVAFICDNFYSGDYYKMAQAYYELESSVYDRLHCTFIGHFDLITRFNDDMHFLDETDPRYQKAALSAMEYLVKKDVPFEINCGAVNRRRKKELYPHPVLLRALHDLGGRIIINSDAHQKELLMGAFGQARACALACGFKTTNILEHDASGNVGWKEIPL